MLSKDTLAFTHRPTVFFFAFVMLLVLWLLFVFLVIMIYWIISRVAQKVTPTNKGYFPFYRSSYEQTEEELEEDVKDVQLASDSRTIFDIEFFEKTDIDIVPVFHQVVPEANRVSMYWTIHNPLIHFIIMGTKLYYNRARPYQIANVNTLQSVSANTPSYPSGHAVQAFALAKRLTSQFPEKTTEINYLAEKVADIRKIGGVHYPSDKVFARRLVDKMFWL